MKLKGHTFGCLEQMLEVMGGKSPVLVITDGDVAMRNAIKQVLPNAHHRLCAWHLLRNATSNVKNPQFVSRLRQCMLGDFDICEFKRKWEALVLEFGLEDNNWVKELYKKRKMWATAHVRGKFFAGFRTTSRCEGLHSVFGRYVNGRSSLVDFLKHYFRWIHYMRYREVEADFNSVFGEPVMQTELESIEKSASDIYTKAVFMQFRPLLKRACTCKVVGVGQIDGCYVYAVTKYRKEGVEWRVLLSMTNLEFKCSCLRLESMGIPCEHLVAIMVHLDIVNLPHTVVYKRWTKGAKDSVGIPPTNMDRSRDPALVGQYVGFMEHCKNLANAAFECGVPQHIRETIDILAARTTFLKSIRNGEIGTNEPVQQSATGLRNPTRVRTKGRGGASSSAPTRGTSQVTIRKAHCCGVCGGKGHNRQSCPVQQQRNLIAQTQAGPSVQHEEDDMFNQFEEDPYDLYEDYDDSDLDDDYDNFDEANIDMVSICS